MENNACFCNFCLFWVYFSRSKFNFEINCVSNCLLGNTLWDPSLKDVLSHGSKIFLPKYFLGNIFYQNNTTSSIGKIIGLIKTPPPQKSTKSACKVQGLQDFLQSLQGARLEKTQGDYKVQLARLDY